MPVDPQAAALLAQLPLLSTGNQSAQDLRERMAGFGDTMRCASFTERLELLPCLHRPATTTRNQLQATLSVKPIMQPATLSATPQCGVIPVRLPRLHANSGKQIPSCPCTTCGTPHSLGQVSTYLSASTGQPPPMLAFRLAWFFFHGGAFKKLDFCLMGLSQAHCTYQPGHH